MRLLAKVLQAGVPIVTVSRRLDHRRVSTTLDKCAHAVPGATLRRQQHFDTSCRPQSDLVISLLIVENLLVGDIAGVGAVGRLLPGAAGRAISGQDPNILLSPAVGLVVLALYAAAAAVIGSIATVCRDFA